MTSVISFPRYPGTDPRQEVPYRYGSETRKYLPDFIVLVEDGHVESDQLRLVVEIKGYRRARVKVPGRGFEDLDQG